MWGFYYEFIRGPFLKFKLLKIMLSVCIEVGPNFTPIRVGATYRLNACKACNSPLSPFLVFDTVYYTWSTDVGAKCNCSKIYPVPRHGWTLSGFDFRGMPYMVQLITLDLLKSICFIPFPVLFLMQSSYYSSWYSLTWLVQTSLIISNT